MTASMKAAQQSTDSSATGQDQSSPFANSTTDIEMNSMNNQYTFSPTKDFRRPSIFQTETIRKMHSAVELNKKIVEKSREASLVLMNIPTPPVKSSGDYNCKLTSQGYM